MISLIKKLPIPISGLMLGLAALGNLMGSYSSSIRMTLGSISAFILLLLIIKGLKFPKSIKEGLNNPAVAGVMSTIPMSMMLLSTYIKPYFNKFAFLFWVISLILNVILILFFTKKYILNFDIKKVFPSYFVLYVGIVVGSVTAPAYNLSRLGQIIFWYGLFVYLPIIFLVIYRVFVIKKIGDKVKPLNIIFAAPASLLLAGYMSSFETKNMILVTILTVLSLFMTICCLMVMPKMLKLKFYPSYSAFTFPFVISAIAINMTNKYLISIDKGIKVLKYVAKIEVIWAVFIVLYVLLRYVGHMKNEIGVLSKKKHLNLISKS